MSEILNSFDLLVFLKNEKLLEECHGFWWPNDNKFEIFISCILTQNTRWENVEKSLKNLRKLDILSLEKIVQVEENFFIEAISPSGFKNQKAKRLKQICKNIIEEFTNFENFIKNTTRMWLLKQKGIGEESADAILCYACKKDYMVVDKYTNTLLKSFSYEFETYKEVQEWLEYGINENYDKITKLYGYEISLNKIYARYHGKIIEFMKKQKRTK